MFFSSQSYSRFYQAEQRVGYKSKKAPRKVLFDKWYAKLCRYWTNFYEDFLSISRKIEIFHQEMKKLTLMIIQPGFKLFCTFSASCFHCW